MLHGASPSRLTRLLTPATPLAWLPAVLTLFTVVLLAGGCAATTASAPDGTAAPARPATSTLPFIDGSTRFAVIGDMGTGGDRQMDVARTMADVHARFPFGFVITVGDNLYGSEDPEDYERKFTTPYKQLLDAGVTFHTSLGNHDDPEQRLSPLFHMNGERYYTFTRGPVQFFALDSTDMTPEQVRWLEDELAASTAPWKIAYFHHPLYSSGMRHGPDLPLRRAIEPVLVAGGVQVVFSGHEHFYERLEPQRGIHYFISGAGGQLRRGNIRRSTQMAAGFDQDNSFMIVEATSDTLWFESVSRLGDVVDAGTVQSGPRGFAARRARRPLRPFVSFVSFVSVFPHV